MASSANLSARITITDEATAVLRQVRGEVEKTNAAAGKGAAAGSSFGAAWGKAALMLGGAGLGVAALTRQLTEAAKAAAEDEQSVIRLNKVLGNLGMGQAAAGLAQYVDATQAALGVSDSLVRSALIPLATATKDAAEAQRLMSLALDISAAGFADTEKAAKALALAATGNTTALSRLRIPMDQAILKSGDLTAITEELARVVGGSAAAAAETAAGKYARFSEAVGELQESLGQGLITALESVDRAMGGQDGAAGAMREMGQNLEGAGRGVAYLVDGITALLGTLPGLQSVDDALSSAAVSSQVFGNTFNNLALIVDGVTAVFDDASDAYYRMTTLLTDATFQYRDSEGAIHSWVDGVKTVTPAANGAAVATGDLGEETAETGVKALVAKERISDLARAMGLMEGAADRQQALQQYRESLREFVEEPSRDAAYEVIQNFNSAYDSFKEGGRRQAEFVVDNYDEMVRTIKNSGLSEQAQSELIAPLRTARDEAQEVLDRLTLLTARRWSTDVVINRIITGDLPVFGDGAATGGYVTGPGTSTSDSIPARLSNGEYVLRAAAVRAIGVHNLHKLNAQGFSRGGPVTFTNNAGRGAAGMDGAYNYITGFIPTTQAAREESRRYEELLREQQRAESERQRTESELLREQERAEIRRQRLADEAARQQEYAERERERRAEEAAREEARRLEEIRRQQQAIIGAARALLEAAQSSRNDFARSIASDGIGFGSITGFSAGGSDWAALSMRRPGSDGAGGPASSAGTISGYMAGRLARVRQFGDVVRRLAGAGLNLSTLREVISAGPDQGTTLGQALLEAGAGEIGRVNTIQSDLEDTSGGIGAFAGNVIMGGAVADAFGNYRGVVMGNGGVDETPLQVNLLLDGQTVVRQLLAIKRQGGGAALGLA